MVKELKKETSTSNKLILVTVRLSKEQLEKIDEIAYKKQVNRSDVIREAVDEYLEKHSAM